MTVAEARSFFPRGLAQPENGYRFSLDSLLLGSFARVKRGWRGADLGCGSGAVSLALLLGTDVENLGITGVELDEEALNCAKKNAEQLGFKDCFHFVSQDVSAFRDGEQQMDFVLMNPPYREPDRGRVSRGDARSQARFEAAGTLSDFIGCAARLLKSRGRLFVVFLPERLQALFRELERHRLAAKRLLMVHGKAGVESKIVLVEAVKDGGEGLTVMPPLVLYDADGAMTPAALEFCPHLACNAREGA
ncbi:tRNA1(Val) (adenine(37)-N6)-methyltransferase [Salidesulfovibrio brasiliensis]|uniref:tRNA1(Val) (adenine(37)-N6)-methyltransferase n=1 Tax=Salidesulfovibrio brasiliensis TaxID=221711 RepID=UPI0006CFBAC7|nr:methyltransferase [Salidesulfovibrio brasiliensis]